MAGKDQDKKKRHERHEDVDAELSTPGELARVREEETAPAAKGPNVFINTLNVFSGPAKKTADTVKMVCDPVLKVCYPAFKGGAKAVRMVCDPIGKVCYPPIKLHWEKKYKRRFPGHAGWMLALDLSLLFLIGSLVVSLMFVKLVLPAIPQPDIVRMQLVRPTTAVSGEPTSIVVAYANGSDSPLAGAEVLVELPDQFVPAATDPAEGQDATARGSVARFFLGSVPPHGSGEVRIDGTLYGPLGSRHPVTSHFVFWKEGDTSPRRESAYHEISVTGSRFALGMTFDEPFLRGTRNAVRISYGNDGDAPIDRAVIRLSPPSGFRITGSVPPATAPATWDLGTLEPGTKGTITVYGVLGEGSVPTFVARAYAGIDGERLLAQEVRGNVDALSTGFTLYHDITDPAAASVRPGETVTVKVRYHNGGDFTLTDASIRLETTDRYLMEIVPAWTGGDLARIAPGDTGEFTAVLRVVGDVTPDMLEGEDHPVIRISAVAEYAIDDDPAKTLRTDSGVTELGISTKVGAESGAVYRTKDGEQLGVGPLPPTSGEVTRMWVVLKLTNRVNPVRNAVLQARLSPDVRWTGRFSVTAGEPLAYLSEERRVIWEVGGIPAFSDGADAGASFEVAYTPGADAVGTVPVLVEDIRLVAEDAVTGAKVQAAAEPVTTAVRFGSEDETGGIVRE